MTTSKVADLAITTPKLADDAVTTPKVLDLAITTPKIKPDSLGHILVHDQFLPLYDATWKAGDFQFDLGNNMVWKVDTLIDTVSVRPNTRPGLGICSPFGGSATSSRTSRAFSLWRSAGL